MADHYVLVIDDDAGNREALRELLEGAGYVVRTAPNGSVGIGTLKGMISSRIVVLLDLVMPDGDGFYFLQRARDIGRTSKDLPVIVMSGDPRSAAKAVLLDVADVLRKPLRQNEVLDAVARHFDDHAFNTAKSA